MGVPQNVMFLCGRDRRNSPSVGLPVYLTDNAIQKVDFPYEHRGGTIIEDLSFQDVEGAVYHVYKVNHANGQYIWSQEELVEIGAPFVINVNPDIIPNSEGDH